MTAVFAFMLGLLAFAHASRVVHRAYFRASLAGAPMPRWLENLETIRCYLAHEEPPS